MNKKGHVIEVCYGGSVIRTINCDDYNSELKSYSRSELSRYNIRDFVDDNWDRFYHKNNIRVVK